MPERQGQLLMEDMDHQVRAIIGCLSREEFWLYLLPVGIDSHSEEVTGWSKLSCNGHAILIQLAHVVIRACETGWQYNTMAKLICIQIVILKCISKTLIQLCSDSMLMSLQPSEIELFCRTQQSTTNCWRNLPPWRMVVASHTSTPPPSSVTHSNKQKAQKCVMVMSI